ncbi:unnamed protein product, partial [Nesidiocoris tenuis]
MSRRRPVSLVSAGGVRVRSGRFFFSNDVVSSVTTPKIERSIPPPQNAGTVNGPARLSSRGPPGG